MRLSFFFVLAFLFALFGCDSALPDPAVYPLVVSGDGVLSDATGSDELFRVSLEGEIEPLLSFNVGGSSRPSCSPNGERVAFESGRGGSVHARALWVLNGRSAKPLAREEDGEPLNGEVGSWAPDGRRVVIRGAYWDSDLYVVDTETGSVSTLIDDNAVINNGPRWSPDGRHIAFTSRPNEGGPNEVFVISPDGTGSRRVVTPPSSASDALYPTWGPGRSDLTYTLAFYDEATERSTYTRRIVNVETGEERAFPDIVLPPGVRGFGSFRWSPDGSQAVFSAGRSGEGISSTSTRLLLLYDARSGETTTLIERPRIGLSAFVAEWCAP